ncbi:MAG: hypothetical protein GQ570_14460 [Helicobacteraceae bacterium]|nr:hypothetical protein [Helicobacteraceae bacterium]
MISKQQTTLLALLVTANLIGAGILAMPITSGLTGFYPSLLMMLLFAGGMFFSAIVLADEANISKDSTFNYPSLYEKHLGKVGKWVAVAANILILYGLLTGYLAGGSKVIVNIFDIAPEWKSSILLALFLLLTTLTNTGMKFIKHYSMVTMVLLWVAFFTLVAISFDGIKEDHIGYTDWNYLPMAIPMIVTAFHFHNLIPTLCHDANWSKDIWKPLALGMAVGFVMNAIWIYVGIGVVPQFGDISLNSARLEGVPVTVQMSHILTTASFAIIGMIFSIIAISNSYIANGVGLKDFSKDFLGNSFNIHNEWVIISIAFLPPLVISYFFADIFLSAISVAGGIGIVFLFGILPSIISLKKTKSKMMKAISIFFLIIFSITLVITSLQTFGIIHLEPNAPQNIQHSVAH